MHHLDEAFLKAALLQLERALTHIEGDDLCDDLFAKMHVQFAITDIKAAIGVPAKETA